ncbi:hypothetical protein TRFO_19859 [Tritrichomonas foetus]|uniref:C-CAP/cofactor C-like domain-containing protein n=1 Tax=Tritrichomonas foetus TaxID=1144522 RepID=A0A1J4KIN9_9EUKA|nr:hypothetical protein [Tritrichomonas foetus]OHT10800.1 hypothetical protein TRFO_19859 [Tritrichomonas foetus]|eukprot:OHT10800.1 hypothetical protein TRFO_19859 [Tritrichomonas foetus]
MDAKLEALVTRLEAAVTKLEKCGAGAPAGDADEETEEYPSVLAFDQTFNPKLEAFEAAAKAIDAELAEMSALIVNCFRETRRLVLLGCRHAKPDKLDDVIKPMTDVKAAAFQWCDKHFRTKWVNHEKAVHEAISIFDWVTIGPSAGTYVEEMTGAVQCYTNKLAMEYRGKDDNQMQWVQNLVQCLKALPEYINDHHKMGLYWNARASKATAPATMKGASLPAAAPAPEPAKPAPAAAPAAAPAKPAGGLAAKFGGLNIGARAPPKKEASVKKVRDNLISVEYFDGSDPVIEGLQIQDIVNCYQCKNCTIKVPSKVKALSFQNCERCTLVVSDVIGIVELTSCKRVVIYLTGAVKSITVDKCDNVQVNLNEESIDCQITTALSSGMNVEVPDLNEEGNMIEFAVPEQIRVQLKDRKLVHEVYVHE